MNKKRLLTSLVLGTAMASQVVVPVLAKPQTNETPSQTDEKWKQDAHTTIGVTEVSKDDVINGPDGKPQLNISFEVPLYVTTAAIGESADLATPDTYDIKNSGSRGIVVTDMRIEKLDKATWSTVEDAPKDKKDVKLLIGNLVMPKTKDKAVNEKVAADITNGEENAFAENTKYKVIAKDGGKLSNAYANLKHPNGDLKSDDEVKKLVNKDKGINISGTVLAEARTNEKAASQFKVTYVVGAITAAADGKADKPDTGDGTGNGGLVTKDDIIGFTYAGDDKVAAGLATK